MSLSKLVVFDRPLRSASAVARSAGRVVSEKELAELKEKSRREGADEARRFGDQQLVEMREEVQQLSEGLLTALRDSEKLLADQVRSALPGLAVEIGRRLLAGWEPPAELVAKICHAALDELFPETNALELVVSPRDAELLEKSSPGWLKDFTALKITTDTSLASGDCLVRSRFGVVDSRGATRLRALEESLSSHH